MTGQTDKGPRQEYFYFSDDGDLLSLRYDNWKINFVEQRSQGTCEIWAEPFTRLRLPHIYNLRTDPLERATVTSNTYWDWMFDHAFLLVPAQQIVGQFLATFREYPPRQKAASSLSTRSLRTSGRDWQPVVACIDRISSEKRGRVSGAEWFGKQLRPLVPRPSC